MRGSYDTFKNETERIVLLMASSGQLILDIDID